MKKIIIIFFILFLGYNFFTKGLANASELIIPSDAIRMRVIPNSNSEYDQAIKEKVKKDQPHRHL